MRKISPILCALVIMFNISAAQEIGHVGSNLWATPPYATYIDSNFIYVAGASLYLLTNDDLLELVGGVAIPSAAYDVKVSGNYAYLATHTGLQVVDISDPQRCRLAGRAEDTGGHFIGLHGQFALTLAGLHDYTLYVISVANPYQPRRVGEYEHTSIEPEQMEISGDYLYTADLNLGLYVVDISFPPHPSFVGNFRTTYPAYGLDVADNLVLIVGSAWYGGQHHGSLQIFDTSDPYSPVLLAGDSTQTRFFYKISVKDNYAYIYNFGNPPSIEIFDISNPTSPLFHSSHSVDPSSAVSIIAFGPSLFISDLENTVGGIIRYDIADPTEPEYSTMYHTITGVTHVEFLDTRVFASSALAIHSVDITDPTLPQIIQARRDSTFHEGLFVDNSLLYDLRDVLGFRIYDISFHDSLQLIADVRTSSAYDIFVAGGYAYLPVFSGINIFDISVPNSPDSVGHFESEGFAVDIHAIDQYLYILIGGQVDPDIFKFNVIDVSDPAMPAYLSSCDLNGISWSFSIGGSNAYVVGENDSLTVLDISDPANPNIVSKTPFPVECWDIEVDDGYAFIATRESGIAVFDISDPYAPEFVASFDTPGYAHDIKLNLPYVYVADNSSLEILYFSPTSANDPKPLPNTISLSQNYPNPFNAQTTIEYYLPQTGPVTIDIFDIMGRKVETLYNGVKQAGRHAVVWDAGEMSSGVYFYRIRAENDTETRKCLLMK